RRYDGRTGAFLGAIGGGGMDHPFDVAFGTDADGDGRPEMYVSDINTGSVLRFAGPLTEKLVNGQPTTQLPVTVLDAVTAAYPSTPRATIPSDQKTYGWSVDVSDTGPVLGVTVTLDVTHPKPGELEAWLVSPAGTRAQLFQAGGYSAQTSLSAFNGEQLTGAWRLEIRDTVKANVGTLNGWSLAVTRGVAPSADPPDTLRVADATFIEGDQGAL